MLLGMYEYCSTNHREGTWDRRQPRRKDLDPSRLRSQKSFVKDLEASMEVGDCVEDCGSMQRSRSRRNLKKRTMVLLFYLFSYLCFAIKMYMH